MPDSAGDKGKGRLSVFI